MNKNQYMIKFILANSIRSNRVLLPNLFAFLRKDGAGFCVTTLSISGKRETLHWPNLKMTLSSLKNKFNYYNNNTTVYFVLPCFFFSTPSYSSCAASKIPNQKDFKREEIPGSPGWWLGGRWVWGPLNFQPNPVLQLRARAEFGRHVGKVRPDGQDSIRTAERPPDLPNFYFLFFSIPSVTAQKDFKPLCPPPYNANGPVLLAPTFAPKLLNWGGPIWGQRCS